MKEDLVKLIDVNKLRHIEGFSKKRVRWLKKKILSEGSWRFPLRVERSHFLVMDGQHRMEVAIELGLKYVPCLLYDYSEVEVWSLRSNHLVTPELIIAKTLAQDIYPYKTAKHRFPDGVVECQFPLEMLRSKESQLCV